MGESSLRKSIARKQAPELGGRYAGVKSSRDELFGGKKAALGGSDEGSDEELEGDEDEDEDDLEDEDEDDLEDEEELDEDEELAGLEGEESGSEGEGPTGDEEEATEGEGEEEEEDAPAVKVTSKRSGKSSMEADSRAMIQALKKASFADVEKGREVRRQLVSHDRLLG